MTAKHNMPSSSTNNSSNSNRSLSCNQQEILRAIGTFHIKNLQGMNLTPCGISGKKRVRRRYINDPMM